jgi:transmembrane sensor
MKPSENIGLLLYKYMRDELTRKEMRELMNWRNRSPKYDSAFREAIEWDNVFADLQWSARNSDAVLEKVKERVPGPWQMEEEKPKAKIRLMTRFLRAAAVTIFMLIFIGYRYSVYENARPHPGTYTGMINGSSDDFAIPAIHDLIRGFKAGKAHLKIVEHDNGDVDYIATNNPKLPNTIYDVRSYQGNSFVLRLPGMGSIWVNASTTIWYPAKFYGDTLRIKLSGEAYFEMSVNKQVVIEIPPTANRLARQSDAKAGQRSTFIRESGTFNVHAYPTDSLKVARDEQSAAWKNKMIYYQNASLKTILDEISRWYNVDVEYNSSFSDKKYNIMLPRNADFSEVIRVLKEQGAKLFVNRKNIYVL